MITDDYCSYEVAKLLKEKGFPFMAQVASMWINENENMMIRSHSAPITWETDGCVPCVTHNLAMKWLRDVYDIHISVVKTFLINDMDDKTYLVRVCTKECHTSYNTWSEYHSTYEEAVEAALKYSLEKLI